MATKTKTQEAQEKQDKAAQEPGGTARSDKNLMPQGDQRNAPQGEQGGSNDPKAFGGDSDKGRQSGSQAKKGGDDFQATIQQIAAAIKTLTEAGLGGAEASRVAVEVWKCS